jgi:hypothetical protein
VYAGYKLSWDQQRRDRIGRIASHWGAIKGEIIADGALARKFLGIIEDQQRFHDIPRDDRGHNQTPAYRLRTSTFNSSLAAILADAHASDGEVGAIVNFINQADRLNRGLDRAWEIRSNHPERNGMESKDQLTENCRYAMQLVAKDELGEIPITDAGTSLPIRVRECLKKIVVGRSPTIYDLALKVVDEKLTSLA